MPLIPREQKKLRDHLHIRLDASVIAELDLYSRFIDSPRDYVVENTLAFLFRKDRDFQDWLAVNHRNGDAADTTMEPSANGAASTSAATTAARRRASTTEAA